MKNREKGGGSRKKEVAETGSERAVFRDNKV